MAGGYGNTPQGVDALIARLIQLEARCDALQNMITGLGIKIDPISNAIVLDGDRSVQVRDSSDGHDVGFIGALPPEYNRADGSAQPGFVLYREDGTVSNLLGDVDATTPPYRQAWQVFDRQGNVVMADDTNGGRGLAKPYVGGGTYLADTDTARWPQTTSGTFLDVATGWYRVQNPKLSFDISLVADPGSTGEARLLVAGIQVSTTQTVGAAFTDWFATQVALPSGVQIGDIVAIELQLRRTSGTGTIYAMCQRFEGDQS